MTQSTEAAGPSPMERQGALIQDLAREVLVSANLSETWRTLTMAFIPHGTGWVGRVVVKDADGSALGGDTQFGDDAQITLLIDALQQASAEQSQAFVSLRIDAQRREEDSDRIAISSQMNHDRDPGDFDGVGGVDALVAQRWIERYGAERVPTWVGERAQSL